MGYQLGVDLGTTFTSAAVGRDGRAEIAALSADSPVMPSVVLLRADGEVLVGEAAVRRGWTEPTRVAREFKRRLGDPTPLVLGGTPYSAEALMSHLLRDVVRVVSEREGSAPSLIVLTHPANFGPYKLDVMREVARLAGLDLGRVAFLPEPQAAAISYASRNRIEAGENVAVYDLGGGTFDVATVTLTADGFTTIGRPDGMDRFGGIDIDSAIVAHVDGLLDGKLSELDPDDPAVQAAMVKLRDDCRAAKETLSVDNETRVAVWLPGVQTQLRLTREDLDDMLRPRLRETIEVLQRCVSSANLTIDDLGRVLMVGGSSRIPAVGRAIATATGRPVAADAHPKHAIACGAATLGQSTADLAARLVEPLAAPQQTAARIVTSAPVPEMPPTPAASPPSGTRRGRRLAVAAVAVAASAGLAAIITAATTGRDGPSPSAASTERTVAATTVPPVTVTATAALPTAPPTTAAPATPPPATTAPPTTIDVVTSPPATAPATATTSATAPPAAPSAATGSLQRITPMARDLTPVDNFAFVDAASDDMQATRFALDSSPVFAAQPGELSGVEIRIAGGGVVAEVYFFVPDGDLSPGTRDEVRTALFGDTPAQRTSIAENVGDVFQFAGKSFFLFDTGVSIGLAVAVSDDALNVGVSTLIEGITT